MMRCNDQHHDNDLAGVTLSFDRDDLTLRNTPFGMVLSLAGLKSAGEPGAPALPRTQVRIAVPAPFWPRELHIDEESWETVVEANAFVAAAQPLRPGVPPTPRQPADEDSAAQTSDASTTRTSKSRRTRDQATDHQPHGDGVHCAPDCSCRTPKAVFRPPLTEGLPTPPIVPPDPTAYAEAAKNPPPTARAVRIETIGTTHIAVVEVAPIRLTAKGGIELCTLLKVSVEYAAEVPLGDKEAALADLRARISEDIDPERVVPLPNPVITTATQAKRLHELAKDLVLNKDILGRIDVIWPALDLPCEYLIVTDDKQWDAASVTPGMAVPGMVAAFDRLAAAKRRRGISTRVVMISDIVNGRWGDFRTGSRDLQEVIRRFLKYAKDRWGVAWLLLGGDVSVVPPRQVAGSMLGHIPVGTKAAPDDNTSYWTGGQLRMKVVNPGDWWSASTANQLVNASTGALIPYDSAGTSSGTSAGWFFTASDWMTRSAVPTEYVAVNGPAGLVHAELMFLYTWNTLPTDFYYASLANWVVGYQRVDLGWFSFQIPYVYQPAHDWDAVGNGIYGQHLADGTDLDGVHLATDLSVGRAPVESATQANTFVDKVLAYEAAGGGYRFSLDRDWPTRVVLASSDWGGPTWFTATSATTPANGEYHHNSAAGYSLLKKDGAPASFDFDLIAHVSDSERRMLPYKNTDNPAVRGWYYARSATDLQVNELSMTLPWMTIQFPLTSEWMVVHGSVPDRTPAAYQLDWTGQDGSMADQERLRKQISTELPAINSFKRLYEDELDLSIWERIAAPVDYLTSGKLQTALNARPHFMSLSGHGNSDGCCGGSVALANSLTNGGLGFIGYADSCLTNQFDTNDAFSEALITNPDGGAVGYVGNTRFSWIGVGDDFQRAFFHRLTTTRHLGLLNDSRVNVFGTTGFWQGYERWAIFTLNLLGDPELQVYRAPLPGIRIVIDSHLHEIDLVPIPVPRPPKGPIPDPPPLREALVQVRAGDQVVDLYADADGKVRLPEAFVRTGQVEVTASHPDFLTAHEVLEYAAAARGTTEMARTEGP